jgi:hypothetical protein
MTVVTERAASQPGSRWRELWVVATLSLLPVIAHAPAWWHGRLLGPGDGAALHLPLRAQVWAALGRGELPLWNDTIFSGTPLLAAYRPGALYPLMLPLSALPPFAAFQVLVLLSLSAAGALMYFYLRRLEAHPIGAFLAGVGFSLGPYLLGHLGDTATVVASPLLPLLLLAAEEHLRRGAPLRLAGALALLLLAGSPEAARAGCAALVARLVIGHALERRRGRLSSLLSLLIGLGLAAPQLVPTLIALPQAGRQVSDLAIAGPQPLPGITGLLLRYVSHTPAAPLALAALPLALTHPLVGAWGATLGVCLALLWGRGPLAAPGATALLFELALCVLAGLSLSIQWRSRRTPAGRRLRRLFLFMSLVSAVALSVSAAALGPLPETLAGAVGVLALSLILYFSLAENDTPLVASVWLLPLTVSFLLQPHGRQVWQSAPLRREVAPGTATRVAVDRAMGPRRHERVLTLTRVWPPDPLDLGFGGLAAFTGRRSAGGYDPMVPLRTRQALDGIGPGGMLRGAFFRSEPARLELLGVRWVQTHASALTTAADRFGLGETLDLTIEAGQPRLFPLPVTAATEVRLGSWLSEAVGFPDGEPVARVSVRLASGRTIGFLLRAGEHTAEWAHDRDDVRPHVAHHRAPILESWETPDGRFLGHRYLARIPLPGRLLVDGLEIERLPGPGRFTLARLGIFDAEAGTATAVSLVGGYVSERGRLRAVPASPGVRLFELLRSVGPAHVVPELRRLPDDEAVLAMLSAPLRNGVAIGKEALAVASDLGGVTPPPAGTASRAQVTLAHGGHLALRAAGPGWLVVATSWDPGWKARVGDRPTPVVRVNHAQLAVPLPAGTHRVSLTYSAPGLGLGMGLLALAVVAAVGLSVVVMRRPEASPSRSPV